MGGKLRPFLVCLDTMLISLPILAFHHISLLVLFSLRKQTAASAPGRRKRHPAYGGGNLFGYRRQAGTGL